MKIVLVILLFYGSDIPVVHQIVGFNNMAVCNTAGQKIMDSKVFEYNKEYADFKCIIIDHKNMVEQE